MLDLLRQNGLTPTVFAVTGEPTVDLARAGVSQARQAGCDQVIGIGGGSVLDAGKAIAMLLTNGGDPLDYLEVVGRGQAITQRSAPMIAIPTTAGTGSEVTRNAVLGSTEHKVKASLRAATMLPTVALVDPELTYSVPPDVTASTGLDAFTQCLEPFVSVRANPLTDSLCREGMLRAARSLRRAYENGEDAARVRGYGRRQPLRRLGPGQCRTRRGAWLCRTNRRHVPGAARRNLRTAAAMGDGGQRAGTAAAFTRWLRRWRAYDEIGRSAYRQPGCDG